jgi:drug/metabolite transporter (DMT)-like permease
MADLNFAYAIDSMRYIFIALASTFLLKERIGLLRWLGIAAIVLGILLVARS